MLTQDLQNQVNRLSLTDRWALLTYLIRSLQPTQSPTPKSTRLAALDRLRGIAKTTAPAPTDAEVAAMLDDRRVQRYL
jgi:hypothetical protein